MKRPTIAAAAIVHAAHDAADVLLADYARELRRRGLRVHGVIKEYAAPSQACARPMVIIDLDGDRRFSISQDLGPGSTACCLDPAGIAAASVVLRRGLEERADLVIANRFGELEAGGSGFAGEMLALMANGVPLLTVVAEKYLDHWRRFTGNAASELPPERAALEAWFEAVRAHAGMAR